MYRYFVLNWNPIEAGRWPPRGRCASDSRPPARLGACIRVGGLAAFHAGPGRGASGTFLLEQDAGAVFGRIFNREMPDTAAALRIQFDNNESSKIVQTGGRRLFERYWGRYVAVVQDAATGETWVLRDPSGHMPCFFATHQGVNLVFSDLEDCIALGALKFTVSWDYIRAFIAYSGYQSRQTALREVSELQLGERVRFSGNTIHRSLEWDPLTIAQTDPIQDPDMAVPSSGGSPAPVSTPGRRAIHASSTASPEVWILPSC